MRLHRLAAVAAILALASTACGSVEDDAADTGGPAGQTSDGDAAASADDGPVTVTDGRGEEITLDAPATTVVGLEWGVIENLVSLGVMPAGAADVEGYSAWVSAAPLDDSVTDVGMRGEPSVDAIVGLDPDLVVATTDLAPNVVEQLEEIVPVLVVRAAAAERPIEQMRDNLTLVAEAVDRSDQADELLADLDAALADGSEQLDAAGVAGDRFALADGWVEGNTVNVRAFTETSLAGAVAEELGLESAWELEGDPDYGLAVTDVEGLTGLGDVHFVYYSNDVEEDPYATLEGNALWESLEFVESGDVHRLPDGIWMFGGPRSVEQLVDAIVGTLAA
ncbi:MAG: iron-siderophore ABC transporter substrate-binding protein [Nitriliruptor sp.]|uniref:ABC transporter substrate-binding protein n=1 Tax=Nitriliruptor sp. TaxID=2448056 RepID=UPI0034A0A073